MPALDHEAYPHLLDNVVLHASPSALLALRATSRTWCTRIDALLAQRLLVSERGIEHPLGDLRQRTANTERRARDAFAHTRSLVLDTPEPEPSAAEFPGLAALVVLHSELLAAMFLDGELLLQGMPYAAPTTVVVVPRLRPPAYIVSNGAWKQVHIPIPLVQAVDKLVVRTHCPGPLHHMALAHFSTSGNTWLPVRHIVFAFEGYVWASSDPEPEPDAEPGAETLASRDSRTWCMAIDVARFILEHRLVRFTLLDMDTWNQTWMWLWPRDAADNVALFRKMFVYTAQTRFAEYPEDEIERAWERVEMVSRDEYRADIGEEAWADERWDLSLDPPELPV